ncbi:MAG TPA: hypothetical protein VFX25_14215 [Streptosporangiaceae bacterium]|nr:hypothetical protein [Streptosporangiaceae bacterium]
MIFASVLGGVIILAILLGVLGDYRARRHGRRIGNWKKQAIGHRVDYGVTRKLHPFEVRDPQGIGQQEPPG